MFARSLFIASVLGSAFALYTARDDSVPDQEILASCPGGPGSSVLGGADRCTLINIVNNPDSRLFSVLGDPQLNCGGSSDDITVTLGGETTVGSSTTVSANFGIDVEGISVGGGIASETSRSQTVSKSISFTVKPGRQAVYVVGTNYHSQTGNVQGNYGSRRLGHFVWFTKTATITQLTPDVNDVVFDVHETACGTDPRDLNNSS